MDIPLPDPAAHRRAGKARSALLARIDPASLTPDARERLDYYRGYERFIELFFESHSALERAHEALKSGARDKARREIGDVRAAETIRAYADAARRGGMTKGEQALIISLNLRWLPYVVSMRQALGLEPVRYRIGEVQREPLAQGAGTNTFHVDEQDRLWKVIEPADRFQFRAIMGDKLEPGRYSINGGPGVADREGVIEAALPAGVVEIVLSRVKE